MLQTLGRGLALFLGIFACSNSILDLIAPDFCGNAWWIDLPGWSLATRAVVLFLAGALLALYGFRPGMQPARRILTLFVTGFLVLATVWNAICVWSLNCAGQIQLGCLVPFSILVTLALAMIVTAVLWPSQHRPTRREGYGACGVAALAALCFPLAQMVCYGKTDYRRSADLAVVFGARAYADGTPSQALYDRVRTAAELYREGRVSKLLFSGGPGDGAWHETDVMRAVAQRMGVPAEAILLDREGLNTAATAKNTVPLFENCGASRVLAVSHAYHLPRVKLSYQRLGWQVYTVPAQEQYLLTQMPRYMAREVAALWVYWVGL